LVGFGGGFATPKVCFVAVLGGFAAKNSNKMLGSTAAG
jgi:hypothetical protein